MPEELRERIRQALRELGVRAPSDGAFDVIIDGLIQDILSNIDQSGFGGTEFGQRIGVEYLLLRLFPEFELAETEIFQFEDLPRLTALTSQEASEQVATSNNIARNAAFISLIQNLEVSARRQEGLVKTFPESPLQRTRLNEVIAEGIAENFWPPNILSPDPAKRPEDAVEYLAAVRDRFLPDFEDRAVRRFENADVGDVFQILEVKPRDRGTTEGFTFETFAEFREKRTPSTRLENVRASIAELIGRGKSSGSFERAYRQVLAASGKDANALDEDVFKEDARQAQNKFDDTFAATGDLSAAIDAVLADLGSSLTTVERRSEQAVLAAERQENLDKFNTLASARATVKSFFDNRPQLDLPEGALGDAVLVELATNLVEYAEQFDVAGRDEPLDAFTLLDTFSADILNITRRQAEATETTERIEATDTFSEIENLVIERARRESGFEIVKGSRAVQAIVNPILREVLAFKEAGGVQSGRPAPDVEALIEADFASGLASRLARQEAEFATEDAARQTFAGVAQAEAAIRAEAEFRDIALSDEAIAFVARDIAARARDTSQPFDINTLIREHLESGVPQRITRTDEQAIGAAIEDAEAEAERQRILALPSSLRIQQWFIDQGILTEDASPEFRAHIERNFIIPAAEALDRALIEDSNATVDDTMAGFIERQRGILRERGENEGIDQGEFEQRQQDRLAQRGIISIGDQFALQPSLTPGIRPTITGGFEREPTVQTEPGVLRGFFKNLGATPGFLNFLFQQEPGLVRDFERSQIPTVDAALFDERFKTIFDIREREPTTQLTALAELPQGVQLPDIAGQRARTFTFEQAADIARRGAGVTPPTAGGFFQGVLPGLRQEFGETRAGIAETESTRLRGEREAEQTRLRGEAERETIFQRSLRRGGRTIFRRVRA